MNAKTTAPAAPRSGHRAGRQLHGGRLTYAILILFTAGSLFPLVWTAIAASRSNERLAQTPRPSGSAATSSRT